jgi:Tol biopolymer transport system component
MWLFRPLPPDTPEMRLQIVTPDVRSQFALSPDGQSLVYTNAARLWLRPLSAEAASPLTGTEGATAPFWSPDNRSIGFFADGKLKRLDVSGGSVQTVQDFPGATNVGASWNADNLIVVGGNPGPIQRVSSGASTREALTRLAEQQVGHRHPQFLPDGQHFLFFASGTPEVRGIYIGSLASRDIRRLIDADAAGAFVPPDTVLFVRQDTLFAQRLDLQRLEAIGESSPIASRVAPLGNNANTNAGAVSASATGLVAYRPPITQARVPTWFDRSGKVVSTVGDPDPSAGAGAGRLSPDGRYLAIQRQVGGNQDIWIVELGRNVLRRVTVDPGNEGGAAWSPEGTRVVFSSNRSGRFDVYVKSITGDAPETLLLDSVDTENRNVHDWSSDGRFVLYSQISTTTARDVWAVAIDGDRKPIAVARTPFVENRAKFSSDGKWITYESNETGRSEIYLQQFPGGGHKWQVSTEGGTEAQWRRDGAEIFYIAPDKQLMAVHVRLSADGSNVQLSRPERLFTLPAGVTLSAGDFTYAPTSNGERFLSNVANDDGTLPPITLILNWKRPDQRQ